MQRLSSRFTFYWKRIFPALWFFPLAAAIASTVAHAHTVTAPVDIVSTLALPLVVLLIGLLLYRFLVFAFVDEVWLDGDSLMLRQRGEHMRVPLGDIARMALPRIGNPQRMTLYLKKDMPGLGSRIVFMPVGSQTFYGRFKPGAAIVELERRLRSGERALP